MEKLADNVWKLNVDSNVYFLDFKEKMIIDTGPPDYKEKVRKELSKKVALDKVDRVIFTHLHYDHAGNFDLFPNAKFYASEEEIRLFNKDKANAILHPVIAEKFDVRLNPLKSLEGFDIIKTPGHTSGSISLFYKKEKILFSGDTLFFNGYGRLDLPTSEAQKMGESLNKLKELDFKILAPGHDY
jgi:glyoxylase-like metal-dependent hydrolase (beta-lactamase superfamily II)